MSESQCIFCDIISGKLPSRIIYEDDFTLVFMDVLNDVDGHMLAVPKKHITNIHDCDETTLFHLMSAIKKVSVRLTNRGYDGINLLNASGECAGQSVPHFHIHLIPRRAGDGIDAWPHFPGTTRPLDEIYNDLR